jgi:hypothetical protein
MSLASMHMTRLIETPGAGIVREILAAEGHTPVAVGVVEDSPPFSYTGDATACTCGWVSPQRHTACLSLGLLAKGVRYEPVPPRSSPL